MRILNIAQDFYPHIGGATTRMHYLFSALRSQYNHEIHILVPNSNNELPKYEIIDSIHVHRVISYWQIPNRIRSIVKNYRIDIICCHNPRPLFFTRLSMIRHIPIFYEVHSILPLSPIKQLLYFLCLINIKGIITLSEGSKKYLVEKYHFKRIAVVYNGYLPMKQSEDQDSLFIENFKTKPIVIGYIGSFHEFQGVEYLLRSIPKIVKTNDTVRFLIVGGGFRFLEIKELAHTLGIDNFVTFTGEVFPDKIKKYYDLIDIFVISRPNLLSTQTAVPLKLIEAMALGKALVVTNVLGLTEIVKDRVDAIIVRSEDCDDIASGIKLLIEDQHLRTFISNNAIVKARSFTWEAASEVLNEFYCSNTK